MSKPKSCCGIEPKVHNPQKNTPRLRCVKCDVCGLEGPYVYGEEKEAIERWNKSKEQN